MVEPVCLNRTPNSVGGRRGDGRSEDLRCKTHLGLRDKLGPKTFSHQEHAFPRWKLKALLRQRTEKCRGMHRRQEKTDFSTIMENYTNSLFYGLR